MVGDTDSGLDDRHGGRDVASLHYIVRMAVHVREVGNRGAISEGYAAAVVQQHVSMHNHVVSDLQIVSERELDVVERFEVVATFPKNPPRQNPAELDPQMHVFGHGTAVEHLPEPDERLDWLVKPKVDLSVILGLQRHVSGVHLCERDLRRDRERGRIHPDELGEVNLRQDRPAELVTVTIRSTQAFVDGPEPAIVELLGAL